MLKRVFQVQVVKYHIEPEENLNDIDRLKRNSNRYKPVARLDLESQNTNAVDCINNFLSPIVFAAGSNRSVKIFDMAVCKCAHTFVSATLLASSFLWSFAICHRLSLRSGRVQYFVDMFVHGVFSDLTLGRCSLEGGAHHRCQ